jgi:hypothetical protein
MIYQKIIGLYPQLADLTAKQFDQYIILQNDGNGDYIAKWEHPTLAKPTDEELA